MRYSAVEIREENIYALRSFLLIGPEAWGPLRSKMQTDETAASYMSLLYGAFCVAVHRKFSPTYTVGDIVRYIANLRIMAREESELINPLVAEDMIRRVLNAPPLQDGGPEDVETILHAEVFVLMNLVAEAEFDGVSLEQFIDEATAFTKEWLSVQQAKTAEQS
ncbi:hypothetical protein E1293_28780 [Actinomadura darangshiensis]|uniref:Uncharacterized protein n=1 Tax=Actinomadura darangshiensis TaxID=705336 RepID=A0A4R5AWR7_9ACTN|nr:hypothetical protein [Actinomadura darangshiensis]TDD75092.1 hypothetical protein E1293_28780 [Actinomadura darangshiensis]